MEILFRGQRKYDNKWIFGNRVKTDNAVYIIQNYVPESQLGEYEVYPDSVGQSVDLIAEDEKKIFTKDIIELTVFDKDGLDTQHICEVVFDQCGVYFINGNKEEYFSFEDMQFMDTESDIRIIGNMIDNPELMK